MLQSSRLKTVEKQKLEGVIQICKYGSVKLRKSKDLHFFCEWVRHKPHPFSPVHAADHEGGVMIRDKQQLSYTLNLPFNNPFKHVIRCTVYVHTCAEVKVCLQETIMSLICKRLCECCHLTTCGGCDSVPGRSPSL